MYYIRRNSHFIKAAAAALSAVMLIGQPAYAVSASEAADENASSAASKEETVYVIADAAGNPNKIIVSDWLNDESNEAVIEDETNLSDIENLKGDEEFSETNDGELEWTADGNDIFYQGTADEELPVTVSVTYYLDGEEVSPEEIAGKSGDITIRYDYVNHKERDVEIDGETNTLHVPFTVVTGFLLDEDVMSDVQITNGRVLSDGEKKKIFSECFQDAGNIVLSAGSPYSREERRDANALMSAFSMEEIGKMVQDLYNVLMGIPEPMDFLARVVDELPCGQWNREIMTSIWLDLLGLEEALQREAELMALPEALEAYGETVQSNAELADAFLQAFRQAGTEEEKIFRQKIPATAERFTISVSQSRVKDSGMKTTGCGARPISRTRLGIRPGGPGGYNTNPAHQQPSRFQRKCNFLTE